VNTIGAIAFETAVTFAAPFGAVSPTRIVSVAGAWPVAARATHAPPTRARYFCGEAGTAVLPVPVHWGASHAPWFGSFQIDQ
jgi:hypothetical protein